MSLLPSLRLAGLCLAGSLSVSFITSATAQTSPTTVAGSLEGKFAVDDSGAATYSIPLSVPPGIAGNEPRLALSYSSQAGNGPLGVGWGLSGLSAITRCGQRLVPHGKIHGVDFSVEDRFCLDGQRLVAVSGDYGADGTEYRTEIESYAKVISNGVAGTGPESFTVWSKGGLVLEYGVTDDSRIEAIKADGTARSEARLWALSKQSDRSDNAITYSYTEDQTNGSYRINRIDYGGNATAGTTATSSVRFGYENRADSRSSFQAGAKINQDKRLTNVQTFEAETLVSDYKVTYDSNVAGTPLSPSGSEMEIFSGVQNNSFGNITTKTARVRIPLSALSVPEGDISRFKLQLSANPAESLTINKLYLGSAAISGDAWDAINLSSVTLGGSDNFTIPAGTSIWTDWVELPWDKTTDLLISLYANGGRTSDSLYSITNFSGATTFLSNVDVASIADISGLTTYPGYLSLVTKIEVDSAPDLSDYDGARSQIVSITQCNAADECVEPVTFSWNDENTSWPQSQAFSDFGKGNYSNDYSYPLVSGDWNGDGFSDLGRVTSTGMSFYLGSASGMSGNFHLNDFSVGSYANSNDNPLITGDWNGDGLVDVARVSTNDVKFYVSRGTGWNNHPALNNFGKSSFANGRDYPIITGDWNGDGRTDVARVKATGIKFYVGNDNGWTDFGELADFGKNSFANGNDYPIITGDWNGDGLSDVGRVYASGIKFYTATGVATGGSDGVVGWESYAELSDLGQGSYNNAENYPLTTGDWNGDGLTDLARVTTSGMTFHLSTGEGWQSKGSLSDFGKNSYSTADSNPLVTGDWNRDGFTDVARVTSTGMKFYIAHDHGWSEFATITDFGKNSFGSASTYPLITGDWNGDGLLDLGRVTQAGMSLRTSLNSRYALLDSVTNSRGHLSSIHYKTLTDNTLYKKGAAATYPEQDYTSAMTVVSSIERDDGIGGKRHIDYLYEGLRGDVTRGSFLGFSKVTSTDRERTTQTVTDYRQDWPFSRRIAKATRKLSNGVLISVKENTWEQVTTKPDVTDVRLSQSVAKSYEINGQTPTDPSTGDPIDPLPVYDITLSAHTENYDVAANLTGWNGTDKVHVNVTVDAGVVIGSSSADSYAMDFANLPQGSTASLINNGDIIGSYGAVNSGNGGHAIKTSIPLKITNNGTIYAGGGAGYNGSSRTANGIRTWVGGKEDNCNKRAVSCTASGGAGGRGAGWYSQGLYYSTGQNGSGGATCTVGNSTGSCQGSVATARGTSGTSGGGLGSNSPTGGTSGIAFNGYSLVTFEVAGLWGGQVSEEATPGDTGTGGNGNTDPTGTANYTLTIAAHTENVNIANLLATETDWDGVAISSVKVVIEPDIVVGSTSASQYAIDFSTLPTGFTAVLDNKGSIVGRYGGVGNGVGGNAVKTTIALEVYNAGVIYAGGGGGHTGSTGYANGIVAYYGETGQGESYCRTSNSSCSAPGGAGGRGAGWYGSGLFYGAGALGSSGGSCTTGQATDRYCTGGRVASATGGRGTDGGPLGVNGQSGGSAGIAFDGYNLITFKNEGVWAGRTVDGPDLLPLPDPNEPLTTGELLIETAGEGQFPVPAGATKLQVFLCANGGGGGKSSYYDGWFAGSGGGGGCALKLITLSGQIYIPYHVGEGGQRADTENTNFGSFLSATPGKNATNSSGSAGGAGGQGIGGDTNWTALQGATAQPWGYIQPSNRHRPLNGYEEATGTTGAWYQASKGRGGYGIGDVQGIPTGSYGKDGYIWVKWGPEINALASGAS